MMEKIPPPPSDETGARDVVEVAVAGALNAVPVVGGWLAIGVQKTFAQQEQQRLNAYLEDFARVVNKLIDDVDGLTAEKLAASPNFFDASIKAARVATATASREKHQSLQNALFNIGLEPEKEADLRLVFLRLIDEVTDKHVRILRDFSSSGGNFIQIESLNRGGGRSAEVALYVSDLQVRGLVEERPVFTRNAGSMAIMSGAIEGGYRISDIGVAFLSFLAGPFGSEVG